MTQELTIKNLEGATAMVSSQIVQTIAAINEYTQKTGANVSSMMSSALRFGFVSSMAGMLGAFVSAAGDLYASKSSFKQGRDGVAKTNELKDISQNRNKTLEGPENGQKSAFDNIQKHQADIAKGEPPSLDQMANDRSNLDYQTGRVKSIESSFESQEAGVKSRYAAKDSGEQGVQMASRAFGAAGKAIFDMAQNTGQSVMQVIQQVAKNSQDAINTLNQTAGQLAQVMGQLMAPVARG